MLKVGYYKTIGDNRIKPEDLTTQALSVLQSNDLGAWTRPAAGLYPHQWLWDSCFIAIGLARVNPQRAAQELLSLMRGQWQNGMMPHMIYNPRLPYRLEAMFWGTGKLSTPGGAKTSGMTQPPMVAIAAETVAQALPPAESQAFIREILPAIIKFHEWIYLERDPQRRGLAVCLHSWESGLDDTPYWTEAMRLLPKPPLQWRWLSEFRHVSANERSTNGNIQHMIAQAHLMKRYRYSSQDILAHTSLAVEDLVFNGVLAAANESLERLAETVNAPLASTLQGRFAPTRRALEELWDPDSGQYYSRDYLTGKLIPLPTIVAFMPLFAGTASPARAQQLLESLRSQNDFDTTYPLPSVPLSSPLFEEQRYWRGPVWINMNWFVIKGLERYGYTRDAQKLRHKTFELTALSGFREYYNSHTGEGLGAHNFSWSAALVLNLLNK